MEIILVEVPMPQTTSFTIGGGGYSKMIEEIKKGSPIFVSIHMQTKTRISVDFQVGQDRVGYNHKWEGCPYKLHDGVKTNFLDFERVPVSYFVLSKKQGYNELVEHIKGLAGQLFGKIGVSKIIIQLQQGREIQAIKNK